MRQFNVAEAKARLSELIDAAVRGERVIIARRNQPLVELVAVEAARVKPRFGLLADRIRIADDFDAPLDDFAEYTG